MPKHRAWVQSSTLGSNMRSSNFIIVPKPNLWGLPSSVAYPDLYITPFNHDLECNGNEAVQHKSRKEHSLDQIVQDQSGMQQDLLQLMELPLVIPELMIEEQRLKEVLPTIWQNAWKYLTFSTVEILWCIGLVVDFPSWRCHFKEHLLDKVFWSWGKW